MLEGIPIRWRLALLSAGLTLVILSGFAVVIGQLTSSRVRSDFNNELAAAVDDLSDRSGSSALAGRQLAVRPDLDDYAAAEQRRDPHPAVLGQILRQTRARRTSGSYPPRSARVGGYRVETRKRGSRSSTPKGASCSP